MRTHDVAIGLAVSWTRRRGVDCMVRHSDEHEIVEIWRRSHFEWNYVSVRKRGPVVDPLPYAHASVAFGIALAQRGPWVRPGHVVEDHLFGARLSYAELLCVQSDLVIVDLEVQKWNR